MAIIIIKKQYLDIKVNCEVHVCKYVLNMGLIKTTCITIRYKFKLQYLYDCFVVSSFMALCIPETLQPSIIIKFSYF